MIEYGFAGRNTDGGILRVSTFGRWLDSNNNTTPTAFQLRHDELGSEFLYYFVADNAFPLKRNIMRPYPERNITNKRRIFFKNYRMQFWNVNSKISSFTDTYSMSKIRHYSFYNQSLYSSQFYHKKGRVPYTDNAMEEKSRLAPRNIPNMEENFNINVISSPHLLRDYLANYFLNPRVALPWQRNYCIYNN
ncbi:hypothetical protein ILUMI_13337 [Ignelater luminosus]|uniref:DDE Tnp4 domain-containing protein n=1 Tax=Ignelater luminosus TaxID=2038154 RepID=A0A8K0CWF4_IGNLU|nr:hypothetical protein ILUMI_13337 [Ignelater luminosus]